MTEFTRHDGASVVRSPPIAGVGRWESDPATAQIEWSDEMYALLGRDRAQGPTNVEELLGRLVHPNDRDQLARLTPPEVGADPPSSVAECRILHTDGGWRRIRVELGPADAGTSRIAGTIGDVTRERDAQDALHEVQECFRSSFEQAPIGMMIIDLHGCYERVNDAFCAMVGFGHQQLIGISCDRITHPADVAADAAALQAMLAGEATSDTREQRYVHASGRLIWAQLNVTLVRAGDGRPMHFIAQAQDLTERRNYEHQVEHMADHDPLTGLLNRRSLERGLQLQVARVQRYGATGGVLMLDLDNFKYFNDTQGHSAGDGLIVRVAQALRARLRDSDLIARLGGDEFAVLVAGGDEQETQTVAETLVQIVRDEALSALDEEAVPALIGAGKRVTVSIGIARFDDRERLTGKEIMANADLAMYDAKDAGGDRWARYRTANHARKHADSQIKWADEIEYALSHDGFELLAQPVVSLSARRIAQYELLLRMRDRQGHVIRPASFLYIAERLGLSGDIDRWVITRGTEMLAEQRALSRDLRIEINLSARTIGDGRLPELIERRLHETGIPPDRLVFEVPETSAVAHVGSTAAFAERLSELGCKFALDDFGAGFGSFYYLKHIPFDYLKIDGEFVRHCAHNATDRTLIAAVVGIVRDLGKHTIAEFAPDQETVELLARLGVDYVQGFYLGRPAPLSEHVATFGGPADQHHDVPAHGTSRFRRQVGAAPSSHA
jgi:diguanylate cyclase (GGDEF)-like protein/PAS domain S-box-containing protein